MSRPEPTTFEEAMEVIRIMEGLYNTLGESYVTVRDESLKTDSIVRYKIDVIDSLLDSLKSQVAVIDSLNVEIENRVDKHGAIVNIHAENTTTEVEKIHNTSEFRIGMGLGLTLSRFEFQGNNVGVNIQSVFTFKKFFGTAGLGVVGTGEVPSEYFPILGIGAGFYIK